MPRHQRPGRTVENKDSVTSPEVPLAEPTGPIVLPDDAQKLVLEIGEYQIRLTSLDKPIWPELGLVKRDLLRFYLDVAPVLLPHIRDRPMVMKRFLKGVGGDSFFMKRSPKGAPGCVRTCTIDHGNGNIINFPMVQDTGTLLWIINFGCIDLNPWHGRFIEVNTPDHLHFDLDPGEAPFERVKEAALALNEVLTGRGMPTYAKTSGSKGIHVYVPIVHGPKQKRVWTLAKEIAVEMAGRHPELVTAEYKSADRPPGRVLVDYNQNRWGATLASVYSVRPTPRATVSMPLTWDEVAGDVSLDDFRIDNAAARITEKGDLWGPTHHDADGPRFSLPEE